MNGEPTVLYLKNFDVVDGAELMLTITPTLDPAGLTILQEAVYGTHGIRYVQTGQEVKSVNLIDPLYFHLYHNAQLVGVYCLDRRALSGFDQSVTGLYGRYLAVADSALGLGYGRLLKQQAVDYAERHTLLPFLFYSYIEEKNIRSMAISERAGFQSVARLRTFFFRRWQPVADSRVEQATPADLREVVTLLNQAYHGHSFRTFARIGYKHNYYVLRERGRIVAGVQANPVGWQFRRVTLGGFLHLGGAAISAISHAPLLSRLFNLNDYRFMALEGLYVQSGREELLPVLLDSVLHRQRMHTAMFLIDEKDPLINSLANLTGGLSGFKNDVRTHLMIKAGGLDGIDFRKSPAYVSSFDYT